MTDAGVVAGAILLGLGGVAWQEALVPWWLERHARQAERRRACEQAGHQWGRVFYAYDSPTMPVRNCDGCGLQEHLTRCPMCRLPVSPSTGRPVDEGTPRSE